MGSIFSRRKLRTRPRTNKFNNISCTCGQGHLHDSRGEAAYCDQLDMLKKAGEIKDYTTQKSFELKVNGVTICQHIPDFFVIENDGRETVHEYKGLATAVWRLKKKLFEAVFPEIQYYVVRHRR